MSLGTANRDGGKTSEAGHLRPLAKIFGGNILGDIKTSLKVSQRGAGANMSVDVAIGDAMLYRSDGTYGHPVFNDAVYNQVITAADPSNPRNDIIVIYVDYTTTPSTGVSNNTNGVVKIKQVAGTPAGSPADPSVAAIQASVGSGNPWAYLARVRVAAAAASIANAVIDDLRAPTQPNFLNPVYSDLINSGCQVAQRASQTLTNVFKYGQVDRFAAKGAGTAVSAGNITQTTAANVGNSGYAIKISGATITGTGEVYLRYRMEAAEARRFKNSSASFAAKVYHDVGSAVNYLITVRKPTVADVFTSVTDIANSGNISVASATPTTISFENINSGSLGDCSNGLEIEIKISSGAITTKNFEFADLQFNRGVIANQYIGKPFAQEYKDCERYYEVVGRGVFGQVGSASTGKLIIMFRTVKRAVPTIAVLNTGANFEETWVAARIPAPLGITSASGLLQGMTLNIQGFSGMTTGNRLHTEADSIFSVDSEL